MRNLAKLALGASVAVVCMSVLAATSASASGPLFINETGEALLFTATSGTVTLRGKRAGAEGTIKCEKGSVHGLALNISSLARELHIEYSGKCEQEASGSKGKCTEPIKPVLSYGELGELNAHILLLLAPESGTKFVTVECTNGNTEVSGAAIGEFKLNGRDGNSQYGLLRKDFLLLFKAKGTTQEPEEIELLGSLMKGVTFKVEGFLGEKASVEAVQLLLFDGGAELAKRVYLDFNPDPAVWINTDPRLKTITIKNVSGENLKWENIAIVNKAGKPTYFQPMGFGNNACPANGGAFANGASCEARVEIEPFVAGENGWQQVEFKDGANVPRRETDPLVTR